jgi:hypothetical protein
MRNIQFLHRLHSAVAGSSISMPAAMQLFLWEAHNGLDTNGHEIFTSEASACFTRRCSRSAAGSMA